MDGSRKATCTQMLEQAARNNFGRAAEIDGQSTSACTALAMAAKLAAKEHEHYFFIHC